MEAWLERLMQGIDPDAPDASLQLFLRLMGLIDWWLLFWLTLLFVAVGGLIGWRRGTFWRDVGLAAALGPLGWLVSFLLPLPERRCRACGRRSPARATACVHCAAPLSAGARQKARQPK
ncbi:hypothetical protein [Tahibacter caeni]|uniref:hypothetical protein n=1 Tax=Tahibacter caeni TaxID=1453545 RepID=UPI0021482E27|nr:hypothetical protein [Tahibacter caeni]